MSYWQEWIKQGADAGDFCVEPPSLPKSVYFGGRSMSLGRAVCLAHHGLETDDILMSPVRECMTPGCLNGKHWHWGTLGEARASAAKTGITRSGDKAGNRKVTAEIVAQLRANPELTTSKKARHDKAKDLGITLRSLQNILENRTWRGIVTETGDAF